MVKKIFFSLVVALLVFAFFFGPLLPFNPVKIGYEKIESNKAIVYIKDPAKLSAFYKNIDQILQDIEAFTGLSYKDKVQVLVATETEELRQYIPWLDYQGLGGVSLQVGNMVYINTPTIAKNNYKEEEFLKHELVHNLISQNTNLYSDFLLNKQHWVSEGTASYFGGPYYYTADEFKKYLANKKLVVNEHIGDIYTNLDPQEPKFNYSLYRFFIGHVIQTHGRPKFQSFLQSYIQKPEDYKKIYTQEFEVDITEDLQQFEQKYREVLP